MNVTELALSPADYGRANYLKREIVAMVRYAQQHGTDSKKSLLVTFMDDAAQLVAAELALE